MRGRALVSGSTVNSVLALRVRLACAPVVRLRLYICFVFTLDPVRNRGLFSLFAVWPAPLRLPALLRVTVAFMRIRLFFLLGVLFRSSHEAPRRAEVLHLFAKHAGSISSCCSFLESSFDLSILQLPFVPPSPRLPRTSALEQTLVPRSLSMVEFVRACIALDFPFSLRLKDPLLQRVIPCIVRFGPGIVAERARRRACITVAKRLIAPLTADLRLLVSDFARPIAGHVDFGLIECLVRVCRWPHVSLVDSLVFGFQPVGDIPFCGCHCPVDEPSGGQLHQKCGQWQRVQTEGRGADQYAPDSFCVLK